MAYTKKQHEEWLNQRSPAQDSEDWIIGGVLRMYHRCMNKYGTALRKYDPVAFRVSYRDEKPRHDEIVRNTRRSRV